jgi:hypothetical protein
MTSRRSIGIVPVSTSAEAPGQRRRVGLAGLDDVEIIHQDLQRRGVPIRMAPTKYPWALEMQLEDPDGNVLRIGSERKPE